MNMKYIKTLTILAVAVLLASCEEFQPVFTGKYDEPGDYEKVTMEPNITIGELKDMYKGKPLKIQERLVIGGQVSTSDQSGNIYKSIYIQDATGGIEIKIGKTGLYNDYKLGQWVYVVCDGLTLGSYNGMVQLGYEDMTGEYDTSYLDVQYIIDAHVFRGEFAEPLAPQVVEEADLKKKENLGKYVTIKGLVYDNEIFCLAYIDPNKNKKDQANRIFLSDQTWNVTTWAMSKNKFTENLKNGYFDECDIADKSAKVKDVKDDIVPTAYSVSQYFRMGNTSVQVRSSGYARFADTEIAREILDGAKVNMTGILTVYNNETQFTLLDLDGVEIAE